MRIISGKHRGRTIMLPKDGKINGKEIRPTSDFAREGIFNLLTHGKFNDGENAIIDARVLDVCAGTGALGLEALSRGAAFATFVDSSRDVSELIRANIERFGEFANTRILTSDATSLPKAHEPHQIAFVDPPYSLRIIPTILYSLDMGGWLTDDAIVIMEYDEKDTVSLPEHFTRLDTRRYGRAVIEVLRYRAS